MGLEVAEKSVLVLGLLLGTGGHVVRKRAKGRRETTCNIVRRPRENLWP